MPSPQYAREIPQRYRLEGAECKGCGRRYFPARRVCPACKSKELQAVRLAREGRILTYTILHVAPRAFALQTPYAVGIIELDDGARMTAPIVDCAFEELAIGTRVRAVFRRFGTEGHDGIIHYGYKFALIRDERRGTGV
jgi:uncharacterized OB-fold protein